MSIDHDEDDCPHEHVTPVYYRIESFQALDILGHLFATAANMTNALANGFAGIGADVFAAARYRRVRQAQAEGRRQMAAELDHIVNGDRHA